MKEYDIYIKRRLTEAEIIVYSLPFRDGVSVTNRMVLDAMLTYLSFQKKIAVAVQSELVAKIDDLLAYVMERINSTAVVSAEASATVNYKSDVEKVKTEIDISNISLFAQSFFAMRDLMGIQTSDPDAYTKVSLGSGATELLFQALCKGELKRVMEVIRSGTEIYAEITEMHKHGYNSGESDIGVEQNELELLYRYTIGMEGMFAITAALGETEFHYSLGEGSSVMELGISNADTMAEKKLKISDSIKILHEVVVSTIGFFSVYTASKLQAEMNVGMKRYRLLSELDPIMLQGTDSKTLEDLDYVILA